MSWEMVDLISETYGKDEYGVDKATQTSKTVFAQIMSVSGKEFFNAGNTNIKPEFKLIVNADEYNGAKIVKIGSAAYSVYRTYRNLENSLELYVERKEGVNLGS